MCNEIFSRVRNSIAVLGLAIVLSACGGGGGGGDVSSVAADTSESTHTGGAVSGTAVGAASLNWSAPVNRADGKPLALSEIKGYRIYYGSNSGNYAYRVDVNSGSTTSYTITGLPVGVYYFVLTTIDVNGRESSYSAEAARTAT